MALRSELNRNQIFEWWQWWRAKFEMVSWPQRQGGLSWAWPAVCSGGNHIGPVILRATRRAGQAFGPIFGYSKRDERIGVSGKTKTSELGSALSWA